MKTIEAAAAKHKTVLLAAIQTVLMFAYFALVAFNAMPIHRATTTAIEISTVQAIPLQPSIANPASEGGDTTAMLTIRPITDGTGYSENHLASNDYWDEHNHLIGHHFGLGATMLGRAGPVDHKDFEALRQGLHPETGVFLRQRHSANRMAKDGGVQSHAQSLFDFTFSAPKSLSIMAVLGGDPRSCRGRNIERT